MLTTSGYFLKKHSYDTLFHPCVKQINISLNSFNKNDTSITFEQYMTYDWHYVKQNWKEKKNCLLILRVWNLDEMMSERTFNKTLFETLSSTFDTKLDLEKFMKRDQKQYVWHQKY